MLQREENDIDLKRAQKERKLGFFAAI